MALLIDVSGVCVTDFRSLDPNCTRSQDQDQDHDTFCRGLFGRKRRQKTTLTHASQPCLDPINIWHIASGTLIPPSFYWKAPCPRQDKRIRYDATGVRSSAHLSTVYIRLRYETLLTDTCRLSSGPMHKEWSGASPAKILYRDKNTNDVILRFLVRAFWTFALNFCDSDVVTPSLLSDRSS